MHVVATRLIYSKFLQDVLEFIDYGCNGFLSNICLVIASYNDMFLNRQQDELRLCIFCIREKIVFK